MELFVIVNSFTEAAYIEVSVLGQRRLFVNKETITIPMEWNKESEKITTGEELFPDYIELDPRWSPGFSLHHGTWQNIREPEDEGE